MHIQPDSAKVASLNTEPSQAAMLDTLMDGSWMTATELANRHRQPSGGVDEGRKRRIAKTVQPDFR
ncbi:hypothetical protein [Desmospora profundinema]|uniref:Uncharacterized protein n=1 Tax=Desmospora profundinema TaxID=1571184 RepID=A0ABU1IN87_9BACL|nr:hypothetical protein [Desmospora profundinema]MDR6226249.1 hypothetical protein [Desmospora profundinema]